MSPKGVCCFWVTGGTSCSLVSWAPQHIWPLFLPLSGFTSPPLDYSHLPESCKVARNDQERLGVSLRAAHQYQC